MHAVSLWLVHKDYSASLPMFVFVMTLSFLIVAIVKMWATIVSLLYDMFIIITWWVIYIAAYQILQFTTVLFDNTMLFSAIYMY